MPYGEAAKSAADVVCGGRLASDYYVCMHTGTAAARRLVANASDAQRR